MMYALFADAWAALRLRFAPAEHYRYPAAVVLAALLVTGAVNAAAAVPLFGNDAGVLLFMLLLTVLKWAVLSVTMSVVLHYFGAPKMKLFGFIAMTEFLLVPSIAVLYHPQSLGLIGMIWQSWILVVQIIGLARLSNLPGYRVLLGYIAYLGATMLLGGLMIALLHAVGILDVNTMVEAMRQNAAAAK